MLVPASCCFIDQILAHWLASLTRKYYISLWMSWDLTNRRAGGWFSVPFLTCFTLFSTLNTDVLIHQCFYNFMSFTHSNLLFLSVLFIIIIMMTGPTHRSIVRISGPNHPYTMWAVFSCILTKLHWNTNINVSLRSVFPFKHVILTCFLRQTVMNVWLPPGTFEHEYFHLIEVLTNTCNRLAKCCSLSFNLCFMLPVKNDLCVL